jgi:hypothetical protein
MSCRRVFPIGVIAFAVLLSMSAASCSSQPRPPAATVPAVTISATTAIAEVTQESSGAPEGLSVSAIDTTTAIVTVQALALPTPGPDSTFLTRVRLREVLFVDRDYLKGLGRSDRMQAGDEIVVDIAQEARGVVGRLRQPDDQIALLLVTTSGTDDEIKNSLTTWGVTAAVNRKSGAFVSASGDFMTASLKSLDPTMVSFEKELAWVAEPQGGPTTKRLTDILKLKLGEGRKPPTWAETDPLLRSLAIGDIPAEERSKFIAVGLAIEWSDPPKGVTAVVRSPDGVSHATGSEAGDHVALGYAKPGDRLTLDLCRAGLTECETLGELPVSPEAPVVIVRLAGTGSLDFAAYAKADIGKARDSVVAPKLRDEIDLYVKQGILDTLGTTAPKS